MRFLDGIYGLASVLALLLSLLSPVSVASMPLWILMTIKSEAL